MLSKVVSAHAQSSTYFCRYSIIYDPNPILFPFPKIPFPYLLQGDSFAKNAGLSESLPHVYQDGTGSYFSWLHLFGKSKRRYNVSRRKKPRGQVQGTNNNIYRQTRYRHIAESRNSAVIPVKIAKRSSTASTYNVNI